MTYPWIGQNFSHKEVALKAVFECKTWGFIRKLLVSVTKLSVTSSGAFQKQSERLRGFGNIQLGFLYGAKTNGEATIRERLAFQLRELDRHPTKDSTHAGESEE